MKTPSLRRFLASALILLAGPAASAAPIGELRYHEPAKGALVPNEPVSYSVAAKAQDFLGFEIRTTEAAAVARILDESGKLIRGSAIDMEGGVSFAAPAAGSYCLELTSQKATGYHIVWVRRVPLEERIRSRAKFAAIGGPRIEALRIDIVAGRAGAVAAFWDEVRIKGAPLIEALPGDPGHMTVTFLWKGTAATRRVLLLWPAQNRLTPGACSFSRLGDTDVWFATVKVNRSKRALYRLVENGPDLPPPQEQEMSDAMGMIWAIRGRSSILRTSAIRRSSRAAPPSRCPTLLPSRSLSAGRACRPEGSVRSRSAASS